MPDRLIIIIIQRRDLDDLGKTLTHRGFSFTHVASYGGFLMEANDTVFVAVNQDKVEEVLEMIREHCHTRTRYLSPASPMLESGGLFPPTPIEVQVGGAHVFIVPISRSLRLG